MRIYTKDANRTASAIAEEIKFDESYGSFSSKVSDAAYKMLMAADSRHPLLYVCV